MRGHGFPLRNVYYQWNDLVSLLLLELPNPHHTFEMFVEGCFRLFAKPFPSPSVLHSLCNRSTPHAAASFDRVREERLTTIPRKLGWMAFSFLLPNFGTFPYKLRLLPPCRNRRHAFPTRLPISPRPFQPVLHPTSLPPLPIPDGPCCPWVPGRGDPERRGGVSGRGQGRTRCPSGLRTQRSQTTS